MTEPSSWGNCGALGGTRTPNLLIRSQMLYPLSYERTAYKYTAAGRLPVRVDVTRTGGWLDLGPG